MDLIYDRVNRSGFPFCARVHDMRKMRYVIILWEDEIPSGRWEASALIISMKRELDHAVYARQEWTGGWRFGRTCGSLSCVKHAFGVFIRERKTDCYGLKVSLAVGNFIQFASTVLFQLRKYVYWKPSEVSSKLFIGRKPCLAKFNLINQFSKHAYRFEKRLFTLRFKNKVKTNRDVKV